MISSLYGGYLPSLGGVDSLLDGLPGRMGADRAGAAAAQTKVLHRGGVNPCIVQLARPCAASDVSIVRARYHAVCPESLR
jgi:hypothetical protein